MDRFQSLGNKQKSETLRNFSSYHSVQNRILGPNSAAEMGLRPPRPTRRLLGLVPNDEAQIPELTH